MEEDSDEFGDGPARDTRRLLRRLKYHHTPMNTAGPLVIDPLSPPLTRDALVMILCKLGIYTFFRMRRVCKKWKDMIDLAMMNQPAYMAREIPRFLEQLARRRAGPGSFFAHGVDTRIKTLEEQLMGSYVRNVSLYRIWASREIVAEPDRSPDVIGSELSNECFCGKEFVYRRCSRCRKTDKCTCYGWTGAALGVCLLPRCCPDPLCCFYVEFIVSYKLCMCVEPSKCPKRHLSQHFPWEHRFDRMKPPTLVCLLLDRNGGSSNDAPLDELAPQPLVLGQGD